MNKAQIDRLREARERTGLNQQDSAKLSGLSQKDISLLESGKKKFIPNEYILFLYKQGIDINWLFGGKAQVQLPAQTEGLVNYEVVDAGNNVLIPITDIKAAAGSGYINTEILRTSEFVHLPPALAKAGKYLCIRIKGSSMSPTLQDGGFVIIRLLERAEWKNLLSDRVYVVADHEGSTYLKRLRNRFTNGFIVLTSDNPDKATYPNFNLQENEIISIWYVEWYLSAKLPNIHDQFYSKIERLENSIDDLNKKFDDLTRIEAKTKS